MSEIPEGIAEEIQATVSVLDPEKHREMEEALGTTIDAGSFIWGFIVVAFIQLGIPPEEAIQKWSEPLRDLIEKAREAIPNDAA